MKSNKLIFSILSIIGLMLTACVEPSVEALGENDSSVVTYLPLIEITGGTTIELECDATSYTDPGAIASAGGKEIELITKVKGTYFGGTEITGTDVYSVSYSAYNDDGIPAAAFRNVTWPPCTGDLVTDISGLYEVTAMTRTPGYTIEAPVGPILVTKLDNGDYAISDAIGGWYEYEYGYGPDYAAKGSTLTANDISANDFTLNITVPSLPWGGDLTIDEFSVDAAAKTISVKISWSLGYVWEYTMTQL